MRKVYYRLLNGPIGVETLNAIAFMYQIDFLRSNGIEPVVVLTQKRNNITLNAMLKKKFADLAVRVIDISDSKIFTALYHRIFARTKPDREDNLVIMKNFLASEISRGAKFVEVSAMHTDYEPINRFNNFLTFTEEENERGREDFKEMGVNSNFVCVHARDSVFYEQSPHRWKDKQSQVQNTTNARNIDFKAYLEACRYLENNGIQSLRMGAMQSKIDSNMFNENIIDYAGIYRTDFMDIWSIAKCKFFLGSESGLFVVPYLFDKPVAMANAYNIVVGTPYRKSDIYIPQNIWHRGKKRLLTFKEISENEIGLHWTAEMYDKEELDVIKSSPEEILDLAKEMNDIIDGRYRYTDEDNYLQQQFKNAFETHQPPHLTPARVGREFLKQNKGLFCN